MSPKLADDQLVTVLRRYLTLLRGHPSAEVMVREILTEDFETGFVGGQNWKGLAGLRKKASGQQIEARTRLQFLNDSAKRLFSTPQQGLNR